MTPLCSSTPNSWTMPWKYRVDFPPWLTETQAGLLSMLVVLILPAATTSTSNLNSSLIVSCATRRIAVRGDSAELVIDSSDFLSSSAMCSATFGVVSQQPSHDRCFQALNASRPKLVRKHELGGDNLAEGCGLLELFHFR